MKLRTPALVTLLLLLVAGVGPDTSPVADAAQEGDADRVRALLRQGADVNAPQPDGMTALHWAATHDDAELVRTLLYAGATVRATTRLGGYTPLHLAGRAGAVDAVGALLAAGADPDRMTETGVTALHFAARANAPAVVAALAAGGAHVDAPDAYAGRTPLMFAAAEGADGAVGALLQAGADPAIRTRVKDYEAVWAEAEAEQERRERVRAAAEDPEEEEEEPTWEEPPAGPEPAKEPAEPEGAAQPDPAAQPQVSPERAHAEPAPDPTQIQGRTPGAEAEVPPAAPRAEPTEPAWTHPDSASARRLSLVQQIGRQGGFTALHYAARQGNRESARALLDAGADPDRITGGDGSSALLVAVVNGNYDLARDLMERGADPNLLSEDGVGPLFATLNIEWSLRTWYPQPQAFRQQETDYLALMELLLAAGVDPNQRTASHVWYATYNAGRMGVDLTGATPFWRAAYAADVRAMRLLAENGADPDVWTMQIPPRRRMVDPDVPNNPANDRPDPADPSGLPPVPVGGPAVHPLHAASGVGFGTSRVAQQHRSAPDGWLPSVKYLVEELGVDPNLRDMDGFTAVHHAAARGDNATILYLVSRGADVTLLSRRGHTTADMANSPEQRAQPIPATVALLEKLGSKNSHQCQACGGATRSR